MMNKQQAIRGAKFLLMTLIILILSFDVARTYRNFENTTLDGDIAKIVAPSSEYQAVLDNPLGIHVWRDGEATAAPNRFAAHYGFGFWMNHVPALLGEGSVGALYDAVALLKMVTHAGLVVLLVLMIGGGIRASFVERLCVLFIISALFQDSGVFMEYFSVIDPSVTYVYFYATQFLFLIAFGLLIASSGPMNYLTALIVGLGAPLLALGGPLNSPMIGVGGLAYLLYRMLLDGHVKMKWDQKTLFVIYAIIWAAYSFWLGRFNTEHGWAELGLLDRYARLWQGIEIMTKPWQGAWFFILPVIVSNVVALLFVGVEKKYIAIYCALALFVVVWILLLPLGGYRDYRHFIVRRDSLLPVNLVLIYIIAHSTVLLMRKYATLALPAIVCAVYFMGVDWVVKPTNKNERVQFTRLITASGPCVALPRDGTLMHWNYESDCQESRWNVVYLKRIGILKRDVLYGYLGGAD
jgi:hypothetical protein